MKKPENLIKLTIVLKESNMSWQQFETLSDNAKNFILNGSLKASQSFLEK